MDKAIAFETRDWVFYDDRSFVSKYGIDLATGQFRSGTVFQWTCIGGKVNYWHIRLNQWVEMVSSGVNEAHGKWLAKMVLEA